MVHGPSACSTSFGNNKETFVLDFFIRSREINAVSNDDQLEVRVFYRMLWAKYGEASGIFRAPL
jgi:hypothetical protein